MSGHDRYLIYTILGRMVEIRLPSRLGGERMRGVVQRVCRDIFANAVEVTMNGDRHALREPAAIVRRGRDLLFLYGDVDAEPERDEDIFRAAGEDAYQGSIHDHLRRTERRPVSKTVIKVGDKVKKSPSDRWRSRVAIA